MERYNPDGTPDTTFGNGGQVTTDFDGFNDDAFSILVQPDGKLVAVGSAKKVSRKTHGSAGAFDIPLPVIGEPGVECRSSNGRHTLVFAFSSNVVSGSAAVTAGTGSLAGSPTFSGNTMTVNLAGVSDVQKITITLSNVTSSTSQVLPDTSVSANMLIGDTTGDKTVNNSDVAQTRGQVGVTVTASNFREDVKVNGGITTADVRLVRSDVGHTLP